MWIGNAYAQGAAGPLGGDGMSMMLFFAAMFAFMYFVTIRPQMKKQKEHKSMLDALQKGDEVVVNGILGKITEVQDAYASVEISKGAVIQVQKQSITTLLPKGTIKSVS